jgi:hypothetical protein
LSGAEIFQRHFVYEKRIRAGFNTSAESGYSSNGIPAVAVELRTWPERPDAQFSAVRDLY